MSEITISYSDVVNMGGDPYQKNIEFMIMNVLSAKKIKYDVKISFSLKNLFPDIPMEDGEDNRIVEVTSDDIFKSFPWEFDANWQDLKTMLRYKHEHGISYLGQLCPICKQSIVIDIDLLIDEYGFLCLECDNIIQLIW